MQFIITRSELLRRSKGELAALKLAFEQAAAHHEDDPIVRSQVLATLADICREQLRRPR